MDKKLLLKIEEKRIILNEFAFSRCLTDPEVVEVSQQLDFLLNQYYDLCHLKDKYSFMASISFGNEMAG